MPHEATKAALQIKLWKSNPIEILNLIHIREVKMGCAVWWDSVSHMEVL